MSTSRAISNRAIPIVMDAGALSDASVKAASHDHADDPSQPLAGPAPVFVMVGDTPIDEAEIAREMQFHRADNPHDARQAAATTLVIRELVRRECERLQLAVEALDGETEDEARVRALVDAEVPLPAADAAVTSLTWTSKSRSAYCLAARAGSTPMRSVWPMSMHRPIRGLRLLIFS